MSHLSAKSNSDQVKNYFYKNKQIGKLCMKLIKENYRTFGRPGEEKNVRCILLLLFGWSVLVQTLFL